MRAEAKIYAILDGKAVLELWSISPIKGYSLRHYDPLKQKWVLYLNWPGENSSGSSSLEGSFRHGRGEFFAQGADTGANWLSKWMARDKVARYTFSDITSDSLRWDNAYSNDGGKTWKYGWIMEFSRTAAEAGWPAGDTAHTYESGDRCDQEAFRVFESLAGRWVGELRRRDERGDWHTTSASMAGYKVLDGCAVIRFLEYATKSGTHKQFGILTYNTAKDAFEDTHLDNSNATAVDLLYGNRDGETIMLQSERQKYIWKFPSSGRIHYEFHQKQTGADWGLVESVTLTKR